MRSTALNSDDLVRGEIEYALQHQTPPEGGAFARHTSTHGAWTDSKLAQEFGVPPWTIRKQLIALQEEGVVSLHPYGVVKWC